MKTRTRAAALAELAVRYALAGQPVLIAANNKAEGSAPLTCIELAKADRQCCFRLANKKRAAFSRSPLFSKPLQTTPNRLKRCANFCRNFATFGATTNAQYP